jgi:hypothetical protein
MKKKKKNMKSLNTGFFFMLIAGLAAANLTAQKNEAENIFLQNEISNRLDNFFIQHPSEKFHSSFRPYLTLSTRTATDSLLTYKSFPINHYNFLKKTIFEKPNHANRWNMQVLPVVDLQAGYDMLRSKFLTETGGGVHIRSDVNNNFSAALTVIGGSVNYPVFTDSVVKSLGIIPGLGVAYGSDNKYQWSNFSGYVSYTSNKTFNFQLGNDKHFIGDGYRSLLLSDLANNYPYFRTSINVWKLQYSAWYTWMKDISGADGIKAQFKNKFGTFHYLSWNICKNANLSLFENIIWQGTDTNRVRSFDVNYLNPVIFFRPVEYSLGSSDNAMIGMNFSFKLGKTVKFYFQAVADEFYLKEIKARKGWWGNKQGVQAGFKYINAFSVKNLMLQGEINTVRPYTYTHGSTQQSYTHYNQPLAHPFGANFYEAVGIISWKKNNWSIDFKGIYGVIGKDTLGSGSNMGQNIFLSYTTRPYEYGHTTAQGVKTTFLQTDLKVTCYLIPEMNLRLELGYIQNNLANARNFDRQVPFFYFGFKSSFHNFYRDF